MRKATFSELRDLLSLSPGQILSEIDIEGVQLSIPVDGQGVRVLVETRTDRDAKNVPSALRITISDEIVNVPIEARATAQDFELFGTERATPVVEPDTRRPAVR